MGVLRATGSFSVGHLIVNKGDLVDDASPIVKGRETLFETVEVAVLSTRATETASAAPGTRRGRTKAPRAPRTKEPAPTAPPQDPAPADPPADPSEA